MRSASKVVVEHRVRGRQPAPEYVQLKSSAGLQDLGLAGLPPPLAGGEPLQRDADGLWSPAGEAGAERKTVVVAAYQLQDIGDYRAALRGWFDRVAEGGVLMVTTPHAFLYERQNTLPSRWNPGQRRLYTPASLMAEVEEALAPNTYRVRHLGDADGGYDYAGSADRPPAGRHDVVLVLEKIALPAWEIAGSPPDRAAPPAGAAPEGLFEPARTRVEADRTVRADRVLLMKLDHLGDFVMGLPALEKARAAFPHAHITLAVGSWNAAMAQALGLFDRVEVFDAFPRNSTEEQADVRGMVGEFRRRFAGGYDLAVDLRSDGDTRALLEAVPAGIKAALGAKTQYPFLDIFLPIDATRAGVEQAWERRLEPHTFSERSCWRNHFEIQGRGLPAEDEDYAILWGPYHRLDAGRYRFEPFSEVDLAEPGAILCDVALDARRVAERITSGEHLPTLDFVNTEPGAQLEFRIFRLRGEPTPPFRFYGGRLFKAGSEGVLHQSEYLSLLVELVAMRLNRRGLLQALPSP